MISESLLNYSDVSLVIIERGISKKRLNLISRHIDNFFVCTLETKTLCQILFVNFSVGIQFDVIDDQFLVQIWSSIINATDFELLWVTNLDER